ncbi:MAG TPA: glycosyltransferase, partial [Devosiaceae bacterium]|nr:glycosyltransferase [Devosiaceae bacterium]
VVVYPGTIEAVHAAAAEAARADIVVKASGVGFADDELMARLLDAARPEALRVFWDVDAPATLAELHANPGHPLRAALGRLDLVLTYGGGDPVVEAYKALGVARCVPIYNALDPETHHPVPSNPRFAAALGFLGNRLPDREARVEEFFLNPAARMPERRFLLGGAGWADKPRSPNVNYIGHVGTADHNAFNSTPLAVLNISRDNMAENGFSPPTRVFEAAGAAACLITDEWVGIELFLSPGTEVLVARDGRDVAEIVSGLTPERARSIGQAALRRVLAEHTYTHRAREADVIFRQCLSAGREAAE